MMWWLQPIIFVRNLEFQCKFVLNCLHLNNNEWVCFHKWWINIFFVAIFVVQYSGITAVLKPALKILNNKIMSNSLLHLWKHINKCCIWVFINLNIKWKINSTQLIDEKKYQIWYNWHEKVKNSFITHLNEIKCYWNLPHTQVLLLYVKQNQRISTNVKTLSLYLPILISIFIWIFISSHKKATMFQVKLSNLFD